MQKGIIGIIVVVILIAGVGYMLTTQLKPSSPSEIAQISSMPGTTKETNAPVDSEEVAKLKASGRSHLDKKGIFRVLYPNDYVIDFQNDGQITRVYKQGPTQQGQTEMYDGVIITFETIELGDKSLSTYVDETISQNTANGMAELTQTKKSITLNGFPGFSYTIRGLGEFETRVVQKDTNSDFAVSITQLVADPENVGFQKEADTILATLELLK